MPFHGMMPTVFHHFAENAVLMPSILKLNFRHWPARVTLVPEKTPGTLIFTRQLRDRCAPAVSTLPRKAPLIV